MMRRISQFLLFLVGHRVSKNNSYMGILGVFGQRRVDPLSASALQKEEES